jgi:hypothetical protein
MTVRLLTRRHGDAAALTPVSANPGKSLVFSTRTAPDVFGTTGCLKLSIEISAKSLPLCVINFWETRRLIAAPRDFHPDVRE